MKKNYSTISKITLLFILIAVFNFNRSYSQEKTENSSIIYNYLDFKKKEGAIPFYVDKWRKAIAVNAGRFKNKYSSALVTFDGKSGEYDLKLTTFREEDGESTYKILVDNELKMSFQNPETDKNFEEHTFPSKKIYLKKGSVIEVQFNSHSNGKIPENGGFAFSRGRLKSLELIHIK